MSVAEKIQNQTGCDIDYGLVSIIMPNHNSEKYIRETVQSVLNQTYQNWELLFVDDCSTDDSIRIVRSFEDDRIKIFQNEKNSGAATSRNFALRMAKGRWIAFLDSDDVWLPEKLAEQLSFMVKKQYGFSYTNYSHMDEASVPLNVTVTGPRKIGKQKMFRYNYLGCLTVIYDAEQVGVVQVEPTLKCRNDYAIWLKACKHTKCYLYDKDLARYRIRRNSLSHSRLKKKLRNQYRLFRVGEGMCAVRAAWYTMINMVFGVHKKLVYVKSVK